MPRKNITKDDKLAEKYLKAKTIGRGLIDNFYRTIENILKEIGVESILEVGCGPGFSTLYLSKFFRARKFEASDVDFKIVKEARGRNPLIDITQESIYKLKRANNSFDLVISLETLEHLERPEKALKELKRVTKNYCLLSVPREPLWRLLNVMRGKYCKNLGNTPGHINNWSKKKFIDLLGKYFKIKKIKTPLPWLVVLVQKT
ncbi:MAG: class I SAM-dependent methyltransferase [Nanoarchaeota archaeon]|nr:class I SAM-dependent methyltransferase [Nanoarchaeota archaeon]